MIQGILRQSKLSTTMDSLAKSVPADGSHTFRRTLASLFIADGMDIKPVQETLRHATCKITLALYAQATTPNKLAAQMKPIDTIVPKTQQPAVLAGLNS